MTIKRYTQTNVSIPTDALLKLPTGKFVGFQYSQISGVTTPTIIWTFADENKCIRTGCFDFSGKYLGVLENEG